MKKQIIRGIAIILILTLTACSGGKEDAPVQNTVTATPKVTSSVEVTPTSEVTPSADITSSPDVTSPTEDTNKTDENGTPNDGIGSWEGSRFISLHRSFTSKNGELELILTGLTNESAAYVIDTLNDYDPDDEAPFRLENDKFVDAEKWCFITEEQDDEADSNQCWAASVSDILLISGWAEGHNDTLTGKSFDSEDTIFEYFNAKITNRGCDAQQGLGWFFTGEFAPDWESSHPAMLAGDPDPADGIIKDFVITSALREYNTADDILQISALYDLDMNSSAAAVFEGSIGFMTEGCALSKSEHAIAVVGIITDPKAEDASGRYKAIIISDSDNDGYPDDSFENLDEVTLAEKNADKEARPNSYTIYKLKLNNDANGKEYWELLGYYEDSHTVLYDLVGLPMVSGTLIDEFRETEGSCSPIDDPDFIPGKMFTTSNTESVMDPIMFDEEEAVKTVFEQGEAVNLNFFITNIGHADFEPELYGDAVLTADWTVTSEDNTVMASGRAECNETIYSSLFGGCLVELNTADGEIQTWPTGKYTVSVDINTDHAIREAYYLNNIKAECEFEIR